MIFALLVALATCAAVWCLTGPSTRRPLGVLFGLVDSLLWLLAGVTASKVAVVIVALFCAACFARPLLRTVAYHRIRRHHG